MKEPSPARKVSTIIIGIFFSISLVFMILWVPFQKVLLQPEPYKQAFTDQGLYQVYPELLSNALAGEASSNLLGGSLDQLTAKMDPMAVDQFVIGMIPPDWFQSQVDSNMDLFFSFLIGNTDQVVLKFDLSAIKMKLQQDASVLSILKLLPACTTADLTQLLGVITGQGNIPICRVPDQLINLALPLVKPLVASMVAQIPDQVPIISLTVDNLAAGGGLLSLILVIRELVKMNWIFSLLPALFFIGLVLISQPGWKARFRNVGICLIIAGSIGLTLDLLFWVRINSIWTVEIERYMSTFSVQFGQIAGGIFRQVLSTYATEAAMMGFVVLVIGIILYIISRTMVKGQPGFSSPG